LSGGSFDGFLKQESEAPRSALAASSKVVKEEDQVVKKVDFTGLCQLQKANG
jgi:hypothetical protein